MHRSGTSSIARVLNLMGLYFGPEGVSTGRSAENAKGFWERRDVRALNDSILFASGGDWDVVSKLDLDALPADVKAGYISSAADVVMNMDAHRPWFVKEPRLCLLFPIWREALETPVCIHIHRNPLEVAQSLHARNGIPISAALAMWEVYNIRALHASNGLPRYFLGYEELLRTPTSVLESLHGVLTGETSYQLRVPDSSELSSFLEASLRRQRTDMDALAEAASPSQLELYHFLRGSASSALPKALSTSCLETLQRYEATVDLAERASRTGASQEARTADGLELQLALRRLELRHVTNLKDGAVASRKALERKVDGLQDVRRDLSVELAVRSERVNVVNRERNALAQERDQLRRTNTAILHERDEAALAASVGRQNLLDTLRRWDAEIAQRQVRVAELDDLTGRLATGLHAWLASRRWRLGNALLAGPRRLLFRRTRSPGDRLQRTIEVHDASRTHARDIAKAQNALHRDFPEPNRDAPDTRNRTIEADAARAAELNRKLCERSVALARSAADIAARRRYADRLITWVEILGRSRSWRLGHLLLSLPRRAIGKGAPRTVADSLSELVREYRSTTSNSLESPQAKMPVVPRTTGSPTPPTRVARAPVPSAATSDSNAVTTPAAPASVPLYRLPESGKVDVVVCVHNALPHVERCLQSVLARTTVDYRVIIVNDGSDGETTRWLREFTDEHHVVELIETNGPLGYTCAANRGLQASTADNVVLLNSDTIVPRLWLEEMLECMVSRERIGIVGPLSNAASWQSVPERVDANGGWAVNDLPPGYNVDEFAELVWLVSERRFPTVDFVNGFCFMVNRHVINSVGYLDEENFPKGYGEENDYCLRAKEAGFELAIADHCFVYHAKSKSFGDAMRTILAKAGREVLERKHGTARIEQGTLRLKAMPDLANIRAKLVSYVQNGAEGNAFDGTLSGPGGCQVLFVLPVRGGSGGANSVVQEVHGMRSLGIDARVATNAKYLESIKRFYPEFLESHHFLFFDSDDDLRARAAPYQVIVATLWSTPALVAPIVAEWPDKLYVYYVQDYEPWFFSEHDANRSTALESYTLIPDMVLMAKTDWICRTVQERHNRPVYRVAPSLDHNVYHPDPNDARADDQVCIAAMVRPATPRRASLRTIRILKQVRAALGQRVRIVLFGCESDDLKAYIDRHARDLRLGTDFENRGVLSRLGVAEVLRRAAIFVDLSDYQAFGRTGLEAMACGCAVVLPRKGGVYEYAVHGRNCMIVDTDSDDDMTTAIRTLATDANLRATITKHALDTAARFDIVRASVSVISVFRAAIALRNHGFPAPPETYTRGVTPSSEPSL